MAIDKMPIEKQDWLNQMETLLPTGFCKEDSIFRQCYTIKDKDCLGVFKKSFSFCSAQFDSKIPTIIQNYQESEKLGGEFGSCISTKYVGIMESRNIRNRICDDMFKKKL